MKISLVLFAALTLVGCAATPPSSTPLSVQKFTAPIGAELTAETGGSIFVEGEFVDGEVIMVGQARDLMIPGSMFIPFPVHVAEGPLVLTRVGRGWKYYCGDLLKSTASFPGLGTVVATGDCIGIRISAGGEAQWVVDNSNHNRMSNTIWTRSIASDEAAKYKPKKTAVPFSARSLVRLTFDGYYADQMHFSWSEVDGKERTTQKFVFDFKGRPTLMGIKGKNFEVIKADNVGFTYRWVKF